MPKKPVSARDQQGRWRTGSSGNPGGRSVGVRNRATVASETLLLGEAEAITRKAIELAKAGDTTALRLCVERILPVRKGRPIAIRLPDVATAADLAELMKAVMNAISAGELTPDEAAALGGIVEHTRRAFELADLEARLTSLERRAAQQGR